MENKEHIHELYELYEEKMQPMLMSDDTKELRLKIIDKIDELNTFFDDEQHKQLEELLELRNLLGAINNEKIFVYTYSLANTLLLESLNTYKK